MTAASHGNVSASPDIEASASADLRRAEGPPPILEA